MSVLLNDLREKSAHNKLVIPDELISLYQWIDDNGEIEKNEYGFFGRLNEDCACSPDITFSTDSKDNTTIGWVTKPELVNEMTSRLTFFADSGMDGSRIGLWLNDEGKTVFIHLSTDAGLSAVIAENGLEFMRLLGIGYYILGDVYDFGKEPQVFDEEHQINPEFCQWIEKTFNTKIPKVASEIIKHPSDYLLDDVESEDPFCNWIKELVDKEYS